MILPKYADMRAWFAVSGAPTAPDGFPQWPGPLNAGGNSFDNTFPSKLRSGGFTSSWGIWLGYPSGHSNPVPGEIGPLLTSTQVSDVPFVITINGGAADSVPGVDEYAWYLSQRSDGLRYMLPNGTLSPTPQAQYFTMIHPFYGYSGTVEVNTSTPYFTGMFTDMAIYVSRLSDNAYQWAQFLPSPYP